MKAQSGTELLQFCIWILAVLQAVAAFQTTPTVNVKRNNQEFSRNFITTENGQFRVNGSEFKFIGANAYWLPTLNTEQDIRDTLSNMTSHGITVVRIWAFNDVHAIPENGTWFQLIANGTTTVNEGPNGLQKLDTVIRIADEMGVYVLLSLTNNWNPMPLFDNLGISLPLNPFDARELPTGTNNTLPRNFLSNDYGGMDTYVREFGATHDEFYTNDTILELFTNYTTLIASRYTNSTSIFAWEVANDPRCSSTIHASDDCETRTVTGWHSQVADSVVAADPNHLVSSGAHGFFCAECPKLFPVAAPPPPPQPSPAPGERRRRRDIGPLTKKSLVQEKKQAQKFNYLSKKSARPGEGRVRIRGRWVAPPAKRQTPEDSGIGSAFDGTHGVDSEDILNVPNISFMSFQLFPDQEQYQVGSSDPILNPSLFFNETVQNGISWIQRQVNTAQLLNKPIAMTGFGLVTQENAASFTNFNDSVARFGDVAVADPANNVTALYGVTDAQRNDAYSQWIDAAITAGVQGILFWQWGQSNLTAQPGTTISPNLNETDTSPNINATGQSPNDGYSIVGFGEPAVHEIIEVAADQISLAV